MKSSHNIIKNKQYLIELLHKSNKKIAVNDYNFYISSFSLDIARSIMKATKFNDNIVNILDLSAFLAKDEQIINIAVAEIKRYNDIVLTLGRS